MSVLFFLPWVTTAEEVQLGSMRLVPYVRGEAPSELHGVTQGVLDGIFGSYGNQTFSRSRTSAHVSHSTIITWESDAERLDLSEEQITARLGMANYLAFSALSQRRFCSHYEYCNSDGYQVVAQRFSEDRPGDTTLTTRRRDGRGQHFVGSAETPRFIRPQHVDGRLFLSLDAPLVIALLGLPDCELKHRIGEAIDVFLRANTDSSTMQERSELVLMRVAFETLLNSSHDTPGLRRCFRKHFQAELPIKPSWAIGSLNEAQWRARWPKYVERPLDAWVQDFSAARNAAAHGPHGESESSVWQRHNHLLFSSWLFPLMVKKMLSDEGLYELQEEDVVARRGFEAFFAYDLLAYADEEERDLWWNRVERELLLPVFANRIF
ncbi:hypothetical protein [Pseudomonas sp. 10S4]|uniref:hypothetical protein n=1 Tax=Pseudomonas sp. 10S4 TaxID=3048583 RepID=UPI002AC9325D|nr:MULTISPECIES: hypothetical protein [unclassified Pseudomonas]MEB0222897.1 hypothetical protein [Pseudomonas sp. 5S1]MEB0293058.1 hypothetical protein [Pseudomonas sp. 10S4]WPX17199.1 hypothetical protein RHM58_25260 [Pseudomonas sp. 10S4]